MRVLHTSDWHLGVTVRNHPRGEDHDAVIAEIVDVARVASPDLIIHTGDMFDSHRPPMVEFGRAIRALRALAEIAPVVLIAGNHDSAIVLDVLALAVGDTHATDVAAGMFDPFATTTNRIRVMSRPTTPAAGAVLTFATRTGGHLRLAALPFVHANRVLGEFSSLVEPNATYNEQLRKIIEHISTTCFTQFDPTVDVAIFASHIHVRAARTSTEKVIHISEDYATDPAHISDQFAYLAFGHIHVPQAIEPGHGRYAGSILEVDFGELGETKQVVVADLEAGRPSVITPVLLTAGRRLHKVRAPLSTLPDHADVVGNGIVEVTVTAEPSAEVSGQSTRDGASDSGASKLFASAMTVHGEVFDTLSAAIAAALPEATVVSVIDARMPYIDVADEVDTVTTIETIGESFRNWLVESGSRHLASHGGGQASPGRIVSMFDEFTTAVDTEALAELPEIATLTSLLEELS
ncbi:MAG: exonuclease SbcCD subunit D [Actinomycetota bacterium]